MYLKLQRVVRTPRSEKIGLFDLDERDDLNQPINFGLLHVHYLADEVRGTLLLAPAYWQRIQQQLRLARHNADPLAAYAPHQRDAQEATEADAILIDFVDGIMREICEPPGVAGGCRVLVCFAAPGQRQFLSNSPELLARDQAHAQSDQPNQPDDVGPRSLFG
jgi:hypothetical protein